VAGAPDHWRGEVAPRLIGAVVRTKARSKPLYVSPGHLMDVAHAVDFVLKTVTRYRLPEPTRWAHLVAGGRPLPPAEGSG
jgi:deoxyribonuclease V